MKPRIWQHKKTKQKCRALPWWEIVDGNVISDKDLPTPEINKPWKFGMLVQIGWLIENENHVWFGVDSSAKKAFKDIGEAPMKKETV